MPTWPRMVAQAAAPSCSAVNRMVIVPFGSAVLALNDADFEEALTRGREIVPAASPSATAPQIVDAAGAEAATGVPASWWLEAARRGDVPHLRLGKYVRFDLTKVIEAAQK